MNIQVAKPSRFILAGLSLFLASCFQTAQAEYQDYIVNCNADCAPLIEKIISLGGTVSNKYQNIDAISISMESDNQAQLLAFSPNAELTKDKLVSLPAPKDRVLLSGDSIPQMLRGAELNEFIAESKPEDFEFNNLLTGTALMNIDGHTGEDTIVAIIDSGTANHATKVAALSGSVIGGENFVPGISEPSATSTLNIAHGTNTGTLIAGHGFFFFATKGPFAQSVATHMPESIFDFRRASVIPMFGSAPDAKLYAMKVFGVDGKGAPESRIIAAMDRAITLRTNYNNGMVTTPVNPGCGAEENPCVYNSMKISVVNMSLGGGTLYAGRDLEDKLTAKMLEVGIIIVAAASNEGFAAMTGGSPGTGFGTLTVGAASTVGNERVFRDIQYGLGIGSLYRPSNHHQMATFSSRGPSADGRISTDVVANGFACLVQDANGRLALSSGTSFSAPSVAGAAAILVGAFPDAKAIEIRNALVQGANPDILGDGSTPIDQGAGFIDVSNAYNILAYDSVDTKLPKGKGDKKVKKNIESLGLRVIKAHKKHSEKHSKKHHEKHPEKHHAENLKPGQVAHFFIESKDKTDKLTIRIENIVASLAPEDQNFFFGDDIYYVVQDAITHTDVTLASGFITADEEIVIDNPQTGIIRLAVMGDWTNAGNISADISISGHESKSAKKAAKGEVDQNESQIETFDIPEGTTQMVVELSWKNNWAAYPTDDIDLILLDPLFAAFFDGATFSSPERVVIDNPLAGEWTAMVQGFTVHNVNRKNGSKWELRVTDQDGKSIKHKHH